MSEPLYDQAAADFLRQRERSWARDNEIKLSLLLEALVGAKRIVDIGCGWGQFLERCIGHAPELWGVDESRHRLGDLRRRCPTVRALASRADRLPLARGTFDAVVLSQTLHEVKLFGRKGELGQVLREVARVLAPGGRLLLLDHQDAGSGDVVVRFPVELRARLEDFETRFRYYPAGHEELGGGALRIAKRTLQDYLTKDWALDSPMERMEMDETHNVFAKEDTVPLLEEAGLGVEKWIGFSSVAKDLARAGGELIEGEDWQRKFLCVAVLRAGGAASAANYA